MKINENTLQAVSIAAFLHDIGKFAERAQAVAMGDKDMVEQEYRYAHAHHTEIALKILFSIEQLEQSVGEDAEQNILNLAARHHKPRNILEKIIAQADQIASGHERATGDEKSGYDTGGRERKRQTPMLSILSRIRLKNAPADPEGDWRYRIGKAGAAATTSNFENFFPVEKEQYTFDRVEQDYRTQWEDFKSAIKPSGDLGLDLFGHFSTIIAICREFQWCLPASTRKQELPDVSLYDHQKICAALASCLYCYHTDHNTLTEHELFNREQEKFILFCGDISGIQKFIYQISSKGAYRTLKGKSFYIQMLAEILSWEFVEYFSLTQTNILYASGGKFYLLLPNLPEVEEKLGKLQNSVNRELLEKFNGELYLRAGYRALSANDLTRKSGRTLYRIWDQLTRQLVYQDRQRYSTLATDDYDSLFGVHPEEKLKSCEVCHSTVPDKTDKVCSNCDEMKKLGRQLGTSSWIAVAREDNALGSTGKPFRILDRYIWLLEKPPESLTGKNVVLLGINARNFYDQPLKLQSQALINSIPFILGSSHRFDTTFDKIARRSKGGFKRLGVLRMDVDSLGKIFSEGLENYQHGLLEDTTRFHSLGRITTLSWQLSRFFGAVLPAMIARNPDWCDRVTVVYSGGDDLFLLGSWDALPEVALEIQKQFSAFACHNSSFSLSGGLVITKGSFPVYKSADMAGEAETAAKTNMTAFMKTGDLVRKSSFTFFDIPMHWQEYAAIASVEQKLTTIVGKKENYPLLRRLREIALSWHRSREYLKRTQHNRTLEEIHEQIQAEKWRWRMVYSLSRFAEGKGKDIRVEIDQLQKFILGRVAGTERLGIELLGVLTRWSELKLRKG